VALIDRLVHLTEEENAIEHDTENYPGGVARSLSARFYFIEYAIPARPEHLPKIKI
jgi:hypothetical protein